MSDNNKDLRDLMDIAQALATHHFETVKEATRHSQSDPAEELRKDALRTANTLSRLAELEITSGDAWHKNMPEDLAAPLSAQLARSARTTLALANATGTPAEGAPLGAARGLIEALPAEWRLWVLQDAGKMSASWQNELGALKNKTLMEMGQEPQPQALAEGPEPAAQDIRAIHFGHMPEESRKIEGNHFANMVVMDKLFSFHPLGGQVWPGQPEPLVVDGKFQEGQLSAERFERMKMDARDLLVAVKRSEMETGQSFERQRQSMPAFYQDMIDIEATNAAMALSMHAQAFDKAPDGLSVGALKGTLALMSQEAKMDVVSRGILAPNLDWRGVSAKAQSEIEFEAKVGALRPAAAAAAPMALGAEGPGEMIAPPAGSGRVEPRLEKEAATEQGSMMAFIADREAAAPGRAPRSFASLARDAAPPQPIEDEPAAAAIDFEGLGFKAGRMLSGFVNEWSPSAIAQKVSAVYAGSRARAEGAIMALNASVDRAAGFVSAPILGAREAASQRAAAAKEGLGEWAHAKAEKMAGWADAKLEKASGFVGAVGELSRAGVDSAKALAGDAALGVKGRLPSAEALNSAQSVEKQKKAVKWASVGGALLVGVAMAPVAGVVFAAVGGWAAYAGFDKGMSKGAELFRGAAGAIPEKLDDLANRLGARRVQLQKSEPTMDAGSPKL